VRARSYRFNGARWAVFNIIGAMGLLLQLGCLWALKDGLGMDYLAAAALAIELAVLHNFVWHFHWTWADRPAARAGLVRRFVRFNLTNGAISICGNLVLMAALVQLAHVHYVLANLLSVAVCSLANFVIGDIVVFNAGATGTARPSMGPGEARS
jgi:putative flippase GtrA